VKTDTAKISSSNDGLALRLFLSLLLLNVVAVCVALYAVIDGKQGYEARARTTTQNMARMADQSVTASFAKIDLALLSAVDELERQLRERDHLDGPLTSAFLITHQKRLTEVSSLRVADATGLVILGDGVSGNRPVSWADRDFFSSLRDQTGLGMVVTNPILGRVNNIWIISLVRRYNKPDGSFAGVVSASIPVTYFGKLLSTLNVGKNGVALLRDANLGLIVRHPDHNAPAGAIGAKGFSKELADGIASGQQEFSFHSRQTADGVERTSAYRRLSGVPFHIVVGLGSEDYLAAWKVTVQWTVASLALFLLVTSVLAWLLWRSQVTMRLADFQRQQSLNRLQKIASRVPGVVYQYLLRPDGTSCFPFASDAIREIYRVNPEEVCEDASKVFGNLHPDDYDGVAATIAQSAKDLTPWVHEYRVKFGDDTVRWLSGNALPERQDDGAVLWHGFITDVTERKLTEQHVRHERQRLSNILWGTGVGTWEWNVQTGETRFNERWAELIGYTLDELAPVSIATWTKYAHPDDLVTSHVALEKHFAGAADDYECESRMQHKLGHWIWVLDRGKLISRTPDGQPEWMAGTHWDISQRKQTEQDLQQQTEALKRSNAELEQFAYVASHDLRQPLRMVNSYLQLIERALADKLNDDTREMMHFATDGAKRMDQMLVSLLEYSRVGRKGEPMQALATRVALDEALHFLAPEIAEAQAAVRISGDWPQIVVSPDEFTRLWQNLIGNAVKYRAPDRQVEIDITVTPDDKGWLFCVADNGIGIDPTQFDRLFKIFQRLHARDRYAGNGIGLAIARKIVERHGGRIWVESDGAGLGSRFYFVLPVALRENAQ
jgi:PAS domain S-box-containing protein